jgi:hypothetical protein
MLAARPSGVVPQDVPGATGRQVAIKADSFSSQHPLHCYLCAGTSRGERPERAAATALEPQHDA